MSILEIKRKAEKKLLNREGVVSVGVGRKKVDNKPNGEISIIVGVKEKIKESNLDEEDIIPKEIGGYKTDVQKIKEVKPLTNEPFTSKKRPTFIGNSGSHETVGSGTCGILVASNTKYNNYLLTCMHTGAPDRDTTGDYLQPAPNDGGFLDEHIFGHPVDVAPMDSSDSSDNIDASLISVELGFVNETVEERSIERESRYPDTDDVGSEIYKEGKTTGYTKSVIDAIDVTISLDYGGDVGDCDIEKTIRVENEDDFGDEDYFADSGDSGSICWIEDDGNLPIGQIFGSDDDYVYLTELQRALDYFDVHIQDEDVLAPGGVEAFTTDPAESVGNKGFIWVEGDDLCYTDEEEVDRSVVVDNTSDVDGSPGYIWIEGRDLCFINESGEKSVVANVEVSSANADPGFLWIEGENIRYIGEDGNIYSTSWFQ